MQPRRRARNCQAAGRTVDRVAADSAAAGFGPARAACSTGGHRFVQCHPAWTTPCIHPRTRMQARLATDHWWGRRFARPVRRTGRTSWCHSSLRHETCKNCRAGHEFLIFEAVIFPGLTQPFFDHLKVHCTWRLKPEGARRAPEAEDLLALLLPAGQPSVYPVVAGELLALGLGLLSAKNLVECALVGALQREVSSIHAPEVRQRCPREVLLRRLSPATVAHVAFEISLRARLDACPLLNLHDAVVVMVW